MFFGVLAITYVHEFDHAMFNLAAAFNQNIGGWNTAKVSEMYSLFSSKTALNADISKWNAVSVSPNTDMYYKDFSKSSFNTTRETAAITVVKIVFATVCKQSLRAAHAT